MITKGYNFSRHHRVESEWSIKKHDQGFINYQKEEFFRRGGKITMCPPCGFVPHKAQPAFKDGQGYFDN